jgi:hypothetical protein
MYRKEQGLSTHYRTKSITLLLDTVVEVVLGERGIAGVNAMSLNPGLLVSTVAIHVLAEGHCCEQNGQNTGLSKHTGVHHLLTKGQMHISRLLEHDGSDKRSSHGSNHLERMVVDVVHGLLIERDFGHDLGCAHNLGQTVVLGVLLGIEDSAFVDERPQSNTRHDGEGGFGRDTGHLIETLRLVSSDNGGSTSNNKADSTPP